jgi:enterochelin esterase-like enzyme
MPTGKALHTRKQSLSLQKSAEGIVPKKKKSGRPEHEEKGMTGEYKRMRRMQKIQKKKRSHLWEATVNSARAHMRCRAPS